jgi:phosphatidylglycerol:prolipoprotein diacylglycerol transferase
MGLTSASGTVYVHPTFLYESLWNVAGFVLLHFLSKKRKFDGQVFLMYIGWYGLGRYFIEGLRSDSLYLLSTDIRVSQLLALLMFAAAMIILFLNRSKYDGSNLYCNRIPAAAAAAGDTDMDLVTDSGETDSENTFDTSTEAENKDKNQNKLTEDNDDDQL